MKPGGNFACSLDSAGQKPRYSNTNLLNRYRHLGYYLPIQKLRAERLMAQKKIVHIVGTGTIGEPLVGILSTFKEQFGIDEVTFHKRTPLPTDRSKVIVSCKQGAKLAVDKERWQKFVEMGMEPGFRSGRSDRARQRDYRLHSGRQ